MLTPYLARVFCLWLALTVAIEAVTLAVVVRWLFGLGREALPWHLVAIGAVVASGLTYPYLWFLAPVIIDDYWWRHVVGEPLIVAVESCVLYGVLRIGWRRAVVAALLCNGASILIGIPLNRWVIAAGWVN